MDVSAFSDAAPVVQVSCAIQAIGNGVATLGESMQVWQCNPRTRNQDWDILPPF